MQPKANSPLSMNVCRCSHFKVRKEPLCFICYFSLNPDIRERLTKKPGDGFEEAYTEACKFLDMLQKKAYSENRDRPSIDDPEEGSTHA
jgi:hypothetical protein